MGFDTNTERCWRIVLPNGEDWDQGDGVPHFTSELYANVRIGDEAVEEDQRLPSGAKPVRFDAPCVTVTCEECEADVGGDDVFTQIHCRDLEEAHKLAGASDWKVTPDGRTYCWDCPVPADAPESPVSSLYVPTPGEETSDGPR